MTVLLICSGLKCLPSDNIIKQSVRHHKPCAFLIEIKVVATKAFKRGEEPSPHAHLFSVLQAPCYIVMSRVL